MSSTFSGPQCTISANETLPRLAEGVCTQMKIMSLKLQATIEIVPTSPFHFDSTFYKPAHFKTADTKWEPGIRWQAMRWSGETLGLLFQNAGTTSRPNVHANVYSTKKLSPLFLENLKSELIWRYNLHLDMKTFYEAVKDESALRDAIKRFRGMRPMHPGSLYEYLVIAIVLQNVTVKRSISMMQALFERYGTLLEFYGQQFWCFWDPKSLASADEQELRELKMGYRAKSLIRVSIPFAHGELDEMELRKKTLDEQEKALLSLYGIGPASVGYIMFDVFHHWDYLKHISPWEQKIYTKIFFHKDFEKELMPVDTMLQYFNKWGRLKNLAVHYLWEDLWWKRAHEHIPWLEKLIRT